MRSPRLIANMVLLVTTVTGLIVLAALVDRVLVARYSHLDENALLFPPSTTTRFQSPEFSYTAVINSSGFRDREFGERKPGTGRIVVIGDSFAYGWGVDGAQAFPKVLEDLLRSRGHDVEVANLGVPGGSPPNYVGIAANAVRVLRPDLVIVAVLQGDDFAQMSLAAEAARPGRLEQAERIAAAVLFKLTPNLYSILERRSSRRELSEIWKEQSSDLLESLTAEQKRRYEALGADVKTSFVEGRLNPRMIQLSVTRPRYFLDTMAVEGELMQRRIGELADALRSIRRTAAVQGASMLVVSVPYRVFASAKDYRDGARLGFDLIPEMVTSSAPDDAIRLASERAEVPFLSVTEEFRELAREDKLYFRLDGHFNSRGHAAFARLLARRISRDGFLD